MTMTDDADDRPLDRDAIAPDAAVARARRTRSSRMGKRLLDRRALNRNSWGFFNPLDLVSEQPHQSRRTP
jgi:hypothetical protein